MKILPENADLFEPYGPVLVAGEAPLAWGWKPKDELETETQRTMAQYGAWEQGVLVEHWTTVLELEAKLGQADAVVVGNDGGYLFAVYGTTEVPGERFDPRSERNVVDFTEEEWARRQES